MPTPFRKRIVIPATALAAAAVALSPAGAGQALAHASCFDRATRPYTSVVDSHLHYRPFGGKAIPFEELNAYLRKSGVHYVNAFGIGQKLPAGSSCTYYLDCPGTPCCPASGTTSSTPRTTWTTSPPTRASPCR
ncbi:hypothetical protein [Streptomyces eurythermus]|uniref:hypothetical protein n=1 Tax=Streptomyces eurythermus TaxID=42237 RepID=UPI0033D50D98